MECKTVQSDSGRSEGLVICLVLAWEQPQMNVVGGGAPRGSLIEF